MSLVDETWRASGGYVYSDNGRTVAVMCDDDGDLAACAPEALRLLLEVEYEGHGGLCVGCGASRHADHPEGHHFGCRWLALMKKAKLR